MKIKQPKIFKHYSILKKAEQIAELVMLYQESLENVNYIEKTNEFINRLENGESLDDILVEAFALAYKAIDDLYGMKLYKVQIMGAYVLYKGDVAEMKTGEGKTITGALPAYLHSLTKKPVYIVTVNEYLCQRDSYNIGKIFTLLGRTTGTILRDLKPEQKKEQYACDIVYSTHSEIGFDYLRDNMVSDLSQKVQRGFYYVIVDEVDSILIDESRTPLIIAGGSAYEESQYVEANKLIESLEEEDYTIDKESKIGILTIQGIYKAQKFYKLSNLYTLENSLIVHRAHNALQAHLIYSKDVDYTVKNNEIVLIDIFTGRLLEGRTFSDGLHQALEAKEKVKINPENKTIASVTYQNLFRMFKIISGMTGTGATEEEEFINVYNMRVVSIPTHRLIARIDHQDVIFSTKEIKFEYVINKIKEIYETKQPILVGTRSVTDSEYLSNLLTLSELKHVVLNAKNNEQEAEIIANAGQKGAITISTNMAGRGTDIKLGEGVIELGGLFVIGTERHEARRIDHQLRGRSGRQGDIGHSQFFVSLQDEIVVRSGLKRLQRFAKLISDTPIISKTLTRAITSAQKKIEGLNFDSRKSILEYDDVSNRQRILTYQQRDIFLGGNNLYNVVKKILKIYLETLLNDKKSFDKNFFSSKKYLNLVNQKFSIADANRIDDIVDLTTKDAHEYVYKKMSKKFDEKFAKVDTKVLNEMLKTKLLYSLDYNWQLELEKLVKLKATIHYFHYLQKNPIQVFVFEADYLFNQYKSSILEQSTLTIFNSQI